MAVYAIGDIQGCATELEALLERTGFDPDSDQLWLVGDLVNRGPGSAEVLRRLRGLGAAVRPVLGNHDIHLLALVLGGLPPRRKDTAVEVREAPDAEELIDWLRHQPLFHWDPDLGWAMVHAGLHPHWDLAEVRRRARAVEACLQGPDGPELAASLSADPLPERDPDPREEWQWLRFSAAVLTRTRYCTAKGKFFWGGTPPRGRGFRPWHAHPGRRSRATPIVYGHWAVQGLHRGEGTLGLDSGCIWGGSLTAARLDSNPATLVQVDCPGYWTPGD